MKPQLLLTAALLGIGAAQAQTPATPPAAIITPLPSRVVPPLEVGQPATLAQPAPLAAAKTRPQFNQVNQAAKQPITEFKLNTTAAHAVEQSSDWLNSANKPAPGEDGRVIFTFGSGLPVVVCAPLRVCVIELQPGERVNKEVQLGDSVRWIVTPAESGTGKTAQTLVVLKPKEVGLDTNLVIPTDKRNYYIRLVSRATEYIPRVAFAYPEEERAAWEAYAAKRAELAKSEVAPDMGTLSIERLKFDYTIEGASPFRPLRVVDNGEKTYIMLPPSSKADEIPVLVILTPDGKEQLVNSRFINGWYEVDRLFDRAALILGVGSDQRKVTITNNSRAKPRTLLESFRNFGSN